MPQLTKHILFKIPSGIHKAKLPLKLVSESKDCWQCNSFLKYFGYTRSSFQHEGSFSLITWDPFPWSRMEPGPPALGGRSLSHWTTRELPFFFFLLSLVAQTWRICLQCRRPGFNPQLGRIPWRRAQQPTPVFLHGESQGQKSLADYSPWGHKECDTTEQTFISLHSCFIMLCYFLLYSKGNQLHIYL